MEPADRRGSVEARVRLLLAALVRDFWVVEEREAVFAQGQRGRRGATRPGDDVRIVYLPRVRYRQVAPNIQRCAETLAFSERRAHFVSAHLRRAARASPAQVTLAGRYGFQVPEGHTFVRAHERGKERHDVMYRSRSALRALYIEDSVAPAPAAQVLWFQFERDVRALMTSLGFAIRHVAASRRGDQGVDVYATKGTDLDQVNWIIQCKCFNPSRRVGPVVVRALAGVLGRYPAGTRGMIVTTSSFSAGAVEETQRTGIRLMDGGEFVRLVATVGRQSRT